jgi:CRISPR-associated protein Csc1
MAQTNQLDLLSSLEVTQPKFQKAKIVELWCAEPVFFASREISDAYYTEGVFGNYALAYALGWVNSPYRLTGVATGKPTYLEDLVPISQKSYILPAWSLTGEVKFRFERFNALSDSYWYAMSNNRVVTSRKDLPAYRKNGKHPSYRASNFPQTGKLRMIDRGNSFQTIVLGDSDLPEYFRLGKFRSKIRLSILEEITIQSLPFGEYKCEPLLSMADLSSSLELLAFDLISIPPVSLIKNLHFRGEAWQIGKFTVPANLQFCGGRLNNG